MDDSTHPGSAAACCPPLPRGGLGAEDRAVPEPEIDQPGCSRRSLLVVEERGESGHALRKKSSAEQRPWPVIPDLEDEALGA